VDCPYCGHGSRVVDSRPTSDGIRRRRVCNECKRRFTTYERLGPTDIKVQKRGDRAPEPFERGKLLRVMQRVCRDRPVGRDAIDRVVRRIEAQLIDDRQHTITSWQLADLVLARLRELDPVAYRRFASDYLDDGGHLRLEPRRAQHPFDPQLGLFEGDDDDGEIAD
jgi:transcriptional repressor NrdR